jgi:fatty-acyl-CoA synthase
MERVPSYVRGTGSVVRDVTLGDLLAEATQRFGGREALVARHQDVRFTWSNLAGEVERAAAALQGIGLQPGDRAGVWATNGFEWIVLQYACSTAGLVLVNVNPAYRSHDLAYVLRKSRIKVLFLRDADARANYRQILAEARAGHSFELTQVFALEDWAGFLARGKGFLRPAVNTQDVANIQYTSGTTGSPKGVLLTHRNLANNGRFIAECLRASGVDRLCVPVPMFHCFGCVIGTLAAAASGATLILPSAQFDAGATLEAIHAERATALYGVPTMFIACLEHPRFREFDLTSLRTGVMAGAPCPIEVMKRVVADMHCSEMTIAYGQTESSPVITMSRVDDSVEIRCSTVGRALPATEVKIVDPLSGETVPQGEQGELCTRGYHVMKGYDEDPEATRRAIDAEGWLHTGDLAAMRPDGYFRITGRAKDMIIRGGENVYPREIEEFLHQHPAISEASVVGVPDEKLGEVVVAWIRLKPGCTATAEEIRSFCKDRIAYYKVPQFIRSVESLPMTASGKVQKYRIREFEIQEQGREAAVRVETA